MGLGPAIENMAERCGIAWAMYSSGTEHAHTPQPQSIDVHVGAETPL